MASAKIPADLQSLYNDLKEEIYNCCCDEKEVDWPVASAKILVERIANLEERLKDLPRK